MEIKGSFGTAKVFAKTIEETASLQIQTLMNHPVVENQTVRIMSDVHAGAGCTIGTTMTITDKVVPNLVGVDIGCGMLVAKVASQLNCVVLDAAINHTIPAGFNIRSKPHDLVNLLRIDDLRCKEAINMPRALLSIGTLGGGNHFIELSRNQDGEEYLIIHSGSRNPGKQVADFYQRLAVVDRYGSTKPTKTEFDLAWLEGAAFDDYLHDMQIMQEYADINRLAMLFEISQALGVDIVYEFATVHNYIDVKEMILRKGAVSAKLGETLLIPINMRDGSLLCTGRGNPDWNCSAPHGAGRIMSRAQARRELSLESYELSMSGIYSTSVNQNTVDEAPDAYKPMSEILGQIHATVDVMDILKPIYNFKASGE